MRNTAFANAMKNVNYANGRSKAGGEGLGRATGRARDRALDAGATMAAGGTVDGCDNGIKNELKQGARLLNRAFLVRRGGVPLPYGFDYGVMIVHKICRGAVYENIGV